MDKRNLSLLLKVNNTKDICDNIIDDKLRDSYEVFIGPNNWFLGLKYNAIKYYEDNNTFSYEIGEFINNLGLGDPKALMILFSNNQKIYDNILDPLFEMKKELLTKRAIKNIIKYSNKLYNKYQFANSYKSLLIDNKKSLLDFCFVTNSITKKPVKDYLTELKIKEQYCGVTHINDNIFAVFYDYAADKDLLFSSFLNLYQPNKNHKIDIDYMDSSNFYYVMKNKMPIFKYKGIISSKKSSIDLETINYSNIPKDEKPIFFFQFNKEDYYSYFKKYNIVKEIDKDNDNKNKSNINYDYNGKGLAKVVKLIIMAKNIILNNNLYINNIDKKLLEEIENHKIKIQDISNSITGHKKFILENIDHINIKENTNLIKLNEILLQIRKNYKS